MPGHRSTVLLLGAGASTEAGIPTTLEMTRRLVSRIEEGRHPQDRLLPALHFVCGALIAYDAAQGSDPFRGLDVERVFAAIQLLSERQVLEVSPFVAAWHPAVDAWDELKRPAPPFFDEELRKALGSRFPPNRAAQVVSQLVDSRLMTNSSGATYSALASRLLTELRQLVAVTSKDVFYLEPLLARLARRGTGLTIATLNYDLSIEQAAENVGIPVSTGINSWLESGRWSWPGNGIRLIKLHGSIDWVWDRLDYEDGEMPREVVRVVDDPEEEHEAPALVFGNRGKLRAKGPFLGLLAEFEGQLAKSDRLIVIGYSFRDDHVNEAIRQWTSDSKDKSLLVVDPHWPDRDEPATPFQRELEAHLIPPAWQDPAPFTPRLQIWRNTCRDAATRLEY